MPHVSVPLGESREREKGRRRKEREPRPGHFHSQKPSSNPTGILGGGFSVGT